MVGSFPGPVDGGLEGLYLQYRWCPQQLSVRQQLCLTATDVLELRMNENKQ